MAVNGVLIISFCLLVGCGNGHYDIDDSSLYKIQYGEVPQKVKVSDFKLKYDMTTVGVKPPPDFPEPPPPPSTTDLNPDIDELLNREEEGEEGTETITMTTRHNEKYVCQLPKPKLNHNGQEDVYRGATALEILEPLFKSKMCAFRLEHYWTYEMCHGRYLRQFHEERDGNKVQLTEYILGKYDEEKLAADIAALRSQVEEGKVRKPMKKRVETIDMPYFEVVMSDGTLCDISGLPRRTRVQYLCYPSGKHEIYSFKETSTCEYEAMILSPLLCAHPDFRPESAFEHVIHCKPADGKAAAKPFDLIRQETENAELLANKRMFEGEFSQGDKAGTIKIIIKELNKNPTQGTAEEDSDDVIPDSANPSLRDARAEMVPKPDPAVVREFLLGKHCLYGGSGWWKYEFCYGKHVNQYHEEGKRRVSEINLGRFDRENHVKWLAKHPSKAPTKTIELRKLVSHHYSNGDFCEIAEKPRTVEVKLKCQKSASLSAVSLYLLEPKTCEYILGVESPIICDILSRADEHGLMDLSIEDFDDSTSKPSDMDDSRLHEFIEKHKTSQPKESWKTQNKKPQKPVMEDYEFSPEEMKMELNELLSGEMRDEKKFKDWLIEFRAEELTMLLNHRLEEMEKRPVNMDPFYNAFNAFIEESLEEYEEHYAESDAKLEL